MKMSEEAILSVENFCVHFPSGAGEESLCAVRNLSFTVGAGEIVGLVGESGSGKSVTALSGMRLLDKVSYSGKIVWSDGDSVCDLLQCSNREMQQFRGGRMGMVFQEPMSSLNPSMRCGRQVAEVLRLHLHCSKEEARQEVLRLFEEVLLPDPEKAWRAYPHELSGGQKQRVMIAMAIACKPRLLIADEPTTALDVTVQKAILELLRRLRERHGISMLFISHDLGVVANIADRAVVMYRGEKVEEGTVRELFLNPTHPYTRGLLNCRVPLDKRYQRLPTVQDFLSAPPDADPLAGLRVVPEAVWRQESERLVQSPPLLEVRHLEKSYPLPRKWGQPRQRFQAVADVSFTLHEGETLGLVGESGCGKTTLGRSMLRLIEPTSGEVLYRGRDICRLSAGEMRRLRSEMQIIFQDPYASLNPRYTVGMALLEPMRLHHCGANDRERREMAKELLEQVQLKAADMQRYPHEFSGGQRQRICIARALALHPRLIICDESVSALDVSIQAQVLNLLNGLKEKYGLTYLFISHDLSVVKYMSHRVMVMQKGRLEELQQADALYRHPQTAYTRHLLDAVPKIQFA